jgi:hypothetical protein
MTIWQLIFPGSTEIDSNWLADLVVAGYNSPRAARPLIIMLLSENTTTSRTLWQDTKVILDDLSPTGSTINIFHEWDQRVQASPLMDVRIAINLKTSNNETSNYPVNFFVEV